MIQGEPPTYAIHVTFASGRRSPMIFQKWDDARDAYNNLSEREDVTACTLERIDNKGRRMTILNLKPEAAG